MHVVCNRGGWTRVGAGACHSFAIGAAVAADQRDKRVRFGTQLESMQ
jgi:hypothetical protein